MVKLKDLLNEKYHTSPGYENRQFGDPLPTLEDITKEYQEKNGVQVKEGQKRQSREITAKFDKAYLNFAKEVRDVIKMIDRFQGDKTDGKIIDKAYSKGLVPLDKLMKSWNSGQQKNPHIDEQTINEAPEHQLASALNKVSDNIIKITKRFEKKDDVDGMVRSWMMGLHARLKKAGIKT